MKDLIINIIGLFFIYMAVFKFRYGDSKIKDYSKRWFIVMALVLIGVSLLSL